MKKRPNRPSRSRQAQAYPLIILESGTIEDIERLKKFGQDYCNFHSHFFTSLLVQRGRILPEIRKSLLEAAKPFEFSKWHRVVPYKYSNMPLSVAGSLRDIGGRFNVGGEIRPEFFTFPALYIAAHTETCLQESFSQENLGKDALFFALADRASFTNVNLSGQICSVIDLREPQRLEPFIDLIKDFTIPEFILNDATSFNEEISLIKDISGLILALEMPNWRLWPMQYDVPATSQLFGQLAVNAGVEGIVYRSKYTGKECLAVFPQNFEELDGCYVKLDDDSPVATKIRILDWQAWQSHHDELEGKYIY